MPYMSKCYHVNVHVTCVYLQVLIFLLLIQKLFSIYIDTITRISVLFIKGLMHL
jgi:hypothetical protein